MDNTDSLDSQVEVLQQELTTNIYDLTKYDRLIQILRVQQNWQLLQAVRKQKLCLVSFTTSEIANWLDDLLKVGNSDDILEFYSLIIKDRPTADYWTQYIEFCLSLENIEELLLKELFTTALDDTVYDFKNGYKVWNLITQYFVNKYTSTKEQWYFDYLVSLHHEKLSYPHESLDESFAEFSKFISEYAANGTYETYMVPANKIYSSTKKKLRYIEAYEIKLMKRSDDQELWIEYMEQVNKYSKFREDRNVTTIFNRAIEAIGGDCIQVWMAYCYIIYGKENGLFDMDSFLLRFVRNYPDSPISYAEFIRSSPDIEVYQAMRNRIDTLDLMHNSYYDQWKVLALSILNFTKNIASDDIDYVEPLYKDLHKFVDFAVSDNNDLFHSVEKMAVSIFQELEDVDLASNVLLLSIESFATQSDVWLFAINFYKVNFKYNETHELFLKAFSNVDKMDWPEKVIEEWLQFEQQFGSWKNYTHAISSANNVMKEINRKRASYSETEQSTENGKKHVLEEESPETPITPKKQKIEPVQRSREDFSIKVTNLPDSITENKLRKFFEDCGTIREIIHVKESPKSATIEFTNAQEVLSALTKNYKKIDGSSISVNRLLQSTLFVNNYPSSYSQEQIKELFEKIGTVLSVRFPSQKAGHNTRRFCYVEYGDPQLAQEAILRYHDKELVDETTNKKVVLQVQVSNPTTKQPREVKMSEKKVRVTNLPFEFNEKDIRSLFGEFEIELVVIPHTNRKRLQKCNNDGIAVILFAAKDSVSAAISKLNGFQIEDRTIHVSQTDNQNKQQVINTIDHFNESRSVGITNLNSSISREQLKLHFEQNLLPVNRVEIFPEHQAALVEFTNAGISGQASMMAVNEINLEPFKITSKSDVIALISGKTVAKKNVKMVPPNLLRRRR